jgi:hypothetical protein
MSSRPNIVIPLPINYTFGAVILWLVAVGLMVAEGFYDVGEPGSLARWSILVAIGAATVSVGGLISRARRVVLDVISWEHKRTRQDAVDHLENRAIPILRKQGGG